MINNNPVSVSFLKGVVVGGAAILACQVILKKVASAYRTGVEAATQARQPTGVEAETQTRQPIQLTLRTGTEAAPRVTVITLEQREAEGLVFSEFERAVTSISSERASQTTEPIELTLEQPGIRYDVLLTQGREPGHRFSLQGVRRRVEERDVGVNMENDTCFICALQQINEEYPSVVSRKHLIEYGPNKFASWNLMLAMLTQKDPQNPLTREIFPEHILAQVH